MQETRIPSLGQREGYGNPLQYCCLENRQGQRILVYYSPWGCKDSDTTEQLTHTKSHYGWGRLVSLSLSLSHTHTHTHTKKEQICMWSFHPFAPSPPPPSLSLGLAWSILIGLPKHATWAYSILRLWAFLFCDLRHDLPGTVLWGFFCIEVNSHMTSMLDCFHLDLFTCLLCFLG